MSLELILVLIFVALIVLIGAFALIGMFCRSFKWENYAAFGLGISIITTYLYVLGLGVVALIHFIFM